MHGAGGGAPKGNKNGLKHDLVTGLGSPKGNVIADLGGLAIVSALLPGATDYDPLQDAVRLGE
jgi:hypothetical protein